MNQLIRCNTISCFPKKEASQVPEHASPSSSKWNAWGRSRLPWSVSSRQRWHRFAMPAFFRRVSMVLWVLAFVSKSVTIKIRPEMHYPLKRTVRGRASRAPAPLLAVRIAFEGVNLLQFADVTLALLTIRFDVRGDRAIQCSEKSKGIYHRNGEFQTADSLPSAPNRKQSWKHIRHIGVAGHCRPTVSPGFCPSTLPPNWTRSRQQANAPCTTSSKGAHHTQTPPIHK